MTLLIGLEEKKPKGSSNAAFKNSVIFVAEVIFKRPENDSAYYTKYT